MTLLLYQCFGDEFVIATGDTKMVSHKIDEQTLEVDDAISHSVNDVYDKVIPLTNNVLLGMGGDADLAESWKDYMQKNAKKEYFLDDLESSLLEGFKYYEEKMDANLKKVLGDDAERSPLLIGFYEDGSTGLMTIENKEIVKKVVMKGFRVGHAYPPTEDLIEKMDTITDFTPLLPAYPDKSIMEVALEHCIYVHSIIASQHDDLVSETCIVHLLRKTDKGIQYSTDHIDVSENIKQINSEQ